jgi:hypothetical protein
MPDISQREHRNREKLRDVWPPFGRVLEDQAIAVTSTKLYHGLMRRYRGYLIIKNDTHATVIEESNERKDKEISLSASAACTVDIWVF